MFNVVHVEEREPHDPFVDLDPRNPPHPSSQLGQNVIRRANQLRKELIGRQKANMGYHHDSSPSEAHSDLTSDEDFNEHPELALGLPLHDRRIVEAAVKMRFNRDFPPMDGRGDTPAQSAGDQDEDRPDDPDAGVEADMDDYRTPRVPSPSDAETLVLGGTLDQEVEAHERDYRTPRVPSPI
eukprot:5040326-Amphidinium_carterae.1